VDRRSINGAWLYDFVPGLKNQIQSDPNFLRKSLADESWWYGYDPENKQASSQCKTPTLPRPEKASEVKFEKDAHCFFLGVRGIVHREFVPPGQTVNQEFYLWVLRRWREDVTSIPLLHMNCDVSLYQLTGQCLYISVLNLIKRVIFGSLFVHYLYQGNRNYEQ
jgi:hypothetical protein